MAAGVFIFGANVYGNILWILVVVTIANIVFLNIGFIVGAFAKNARAADGMANAIAMPMMFPTVVTSQRARVMTMTTMVFLTNVK